MSHSQRETKRTQKRDLVKQAVDTRTAQLQELQVRWCSGEGEEELCRERQDPGTATWRAGLHSAACAEPRLWSAQAQALPHPRTVAGPLRPQRMEFQPTHTQSSIVPLCSADMTCAPDATRDAPARC